MGIQRVLIMGAAGRDFHNFNTYFRSNPDYEIVAFTATQIPKIEGRNYPPELSGERYPDGVPILSEERLGDLIEEHNIDQVVFAYSDTSHEYVMHKASRVLAAGADFRLLGLRNTTLRSTKPVISVCATRTGSGKSQTSRHIVEIMRTLGHRTAVIRHPMPYGDLVKQAVQRFAKLEDLDAANCTIEEREEYEPHIDRGVVVFAGVDYEKILRRAEEEVDVILWDGGNNDLPFIFSDMHIVLVDPHRPGHELRYYPGESNLLLADVILINKIDTASLADITQVRENVQGANPDATILEAASPILVENPELIKGKKVLVVEDGPTLTHGEMAYGAGWVAAKRYGAREIIDPRPFAVGSISQVYEKYLTVGNVLPAMGYGEGQIRELEQTINRSDAEVVIIGTPIDLGRLMDLRSPTLRIRYELQIIGKPTLEELIEAKFGRKEAAGA